MKINFITSCLALSGGMKVVFEYANRLAERGHEVRIIYPSYFPDSPWSGRKWYKRKFTFSGVMRLFKRHLKPAGVDWFPLKAELVKVPVLDERFIPDADISVTTFWEVAYWTCKYSEKKGKKFYLIQHYEVWVGGPKEKVEEAYRLGFSNIVISGWLKEIVERSGGRVAAVIPNGINSKEFYPEHSPRGGAGLRVLLPYRTAEWKGINDGLAAFQIAKNKHPDIRLVLFGPAPRPGELPADAEFHLLPIRDELRKIYNSSDIFVFPSHAEGFGLPPFEAMACRIPVVTTAVGAVLENVISGETAMICQPGDVEGMAQRIIELIENKEKRDGIAEKGFHHVKKLSWENSTSKMEGLFEKCLSNSDPASSSY